MNCKVFKASNKAVKIRGLVDGTLEVFGAAVLDDDDPRAIYTRWCNEVFPLVFKPLKHGPIVDISCKDSVAIDDPDISLEHKKTIRSGSGKTCSGQKNEGVIKRLTIFGSFMEGFCQQMLHKIAKKVLRERP